VAICRDLLRARSRRCKRGKAGDELEPLPGSPDDDGGEQSLQRDRAGQRLHAFLAEVDVGWDTNPSSGALRAPESLLLLAT